MSKVKIAVYPGDKGGCGYYRLIWPALAIKDAYPDECEVLIGDSAPNIKLEWNQSFEGHPPEWATVTNAYPEFDVDVMVFQRPMHKEMADAFKFLRARGIKIVIDIDDNFDVIDSRNAAWFGSAPYWHTPVEAARYVKKYGNSARPIKQSEYGDWVFLPGYKGRTHREHIHASLKHADILTVSTPDILQTYKNGPTTSLILPNNVPASYLNVTHTGNEIPKLGWTGTLATHPDDFKTVGSAIKQAKAKQDFIFKIIGDGGGIKEATGVDPDEVTEWVPIERYPFEFATLDLMVCPLATNRFNRSKSWLKPLEAASLSVVPIMSDLPEYLALHKQGIGLVATRPREWESAILKLLKSPNMMHEMQAAGKEVASKFVIEKNVSSWYEAWTM